MAKRRTDVMSALGQKRTFSEVCAMSALPPKADIATPLGAEEQKQLQAMTELLL